jgi:hypothetical protein
MSHLSPALLGLRPQSTAWARCRAAQCRHVSVRRETHRAHQGVPLILKSRILLVQNRTERLFAIHRFGATSRSVKRRGGPNAILCSYSPLVGVSRRSSSFTHPIGLCPRPCADVFEAGVVVHREVVHTHSRAGPRGLTRRRRRSRRDPDSGPEPPILRMRRGSRAATVGACHLSASASPSPSSPACSAMC